MTDTTQLAAQIWRLMNLKEQTPPTKAELAASERLLEQIQLNAADFQQRLLTLRRTNVSNP